MSIIVNQHLPIIIGPKYFPVFWHGALLLCLPTLATYSYLVHHEHEVVTAGLMMSVVLLMAFVDWLSFCVISGLGFVVGHIFYLIFSFLTGTPLSEYGGSFELTSIYLALTCAVAAMMKYASEKEVKVMKIFGGAVAHEVRSPMASAYSGIGMVADVIQRSTVIPAVNKALLDSGVINMDSKVLIMKNSDYELINELSESTKGVLMHGMQSAESILMAMSDANNDNEVGEYSTLEAAREAVKNHHMEQEELSRVHIIEDSEDFSFFGSYKLFKHVVHNLLSNSLKYAGPTAQITIWTEGRTLYFRDSGHGIEPQSIGHIFDLFYTKDGAGLGLAFCKTVITNMGGTITCKSELGKYTEFAITLPEIITKAEDIA
jgi:signal transduction histidine kinase